MKFNWGFGIALVVVIFAVGVGALVYIAASQKVDLVTDDYYEQELKHQDRIDESKRSSDLKEKIEVRAANSELKIIFPNSFLSREITGTIMLYRPSDRKIDIMLPLVLDSANTQTILTSSFQKGLWRTKIMWEYQKEKYYQEEVVIIQ
ncbi:MAG: FixH family protein [Ignavibacteriales bacterium]|nr:FixH family protein [Ignavibacteriales bacterium]